MGTRGRFLTAAIAVLFTLWTLTGCAREHCAVTALPLPSTPDSFSAGVQPSARLKLSLPRLADDAAGEELNCTVDADLVGVYQGSLRLQYDPSCLAVLAVEPGALLPPDCLFLSACDAQGSAYARSRFSSNWELSTARATAARSSGPMVLTAGTHPPTLARIGAMICGLRGSRTL